MKLITKIISYLLLLVFANTMFSSELISLMRQEAEVCNVYEIPKSNQNSEENKESEREDSKEDVEDFYIEIFLLLNFTSFIETTGNTHRCDYYNTLMEIPTPPPEAAIL